MNELQIFNNEEFGQVRTIEVDGKIGFVGKDIATALGYAEPTKAVRTHCKGVSKMDIPTNSGIQNMSIIFEGDVYRLIIKSKLPSAEKFETWVFDEVLPVLRKTGSYSINNNMSYTQMFVMAAKAMEEHEARLNAQQKQLENHTEKLEKLEERVGKAHDVDAVTASKIARDLGFFSESGNPHAELITAVARLCKINVTRNSFFDNEYSQAVIENVNGAAIPVVYFKPPAQEKIYDWLEANLNDSYDYSKYRIKCRGHKPGDIREEWFEINNKHYKVYNEDGKQITEVDWTDDYTGNLMDEYE